ncbi:MAG: UDP-N-acetylmuramoyl-L-alanyl-D-glutamate--2,6-diaminopimelate ligase [Desulfofustis sp.]|nr:UDP-N-acetylmuramoyl-L-alanyl-D-glutamate--2,6-diaminopimelate ligase [Desulfofustis sp.]
MIYTEQGTEHSQSIPLAELIASLPNLVSAPVLVDSVMIGELCDDSRVVGPASLFVAVKGDHHDGHDSLDEAIAGGAVAVVVDHGCIDKQKKSELEAVVLEVEDSRAALGLLAEAFYRYPATEMTMVGITGTNGKTTVSYLIEQTLREIGVQTGVIGTVEYRYILRDGTCVSQPAPLTTPDPVKLQHLLREMADNGVSHVIMEASSHALQQYRLGSLKFDLGIFTNLSQDHLDYHLTMDDYFMAKIRLFTHHMKADGTAVIVAQQSNLAGEERSARVIELCRMLPITSIVCGATESSDVKLTGHDSTLAGVRCELVDEKGHSYRIESILIGRFNIDNLMTAFSVLAALGYDKARCAELLGRAAGAPGRIEPVRLAGKPDGQPTVVVDYAHTPDALEKVLGALKSLEHERLICVFGCGGDRDELKRPLMGEIAARLADITIVTDDNPRREDPASIRRSVIEGVVRAGLKRRSADWLDHYQPGESGYIEIDGRGTAIHTAVTRGRKGDIVLIAGKGHENYQIVGSETRFFDDMLCAQQSSLAWDLQSLITATGGTLVRESGQSRFGEISTDTRTISENDIFVALQGDQFDGHDFLENAIGGGARCLVVSAVDRLPEADVVCIQVMDTLAALGDLARYRLDRVRPLSQPVVVGLTGSCGKTTVKDMAAAIFSVHWPDRADQPTGRVLKTVGNFNNLIGLPLSLLPVSVQHRILVLEMGMNRPGEIARLAQIGDPDICCITNVQPAHLEGLGTIEGVAAAKGELFERSRTNSVHVVNLDDEHIVGLSKRYSNKVIGFAVTSKGAGRETVVWAENVATDDDGHLNFTLHVGKHNTELYLHTLGLHNVSNCCAAAAIAHAAGIDFETIVAGLEQFRASSRRMERLTSPKGLKILNDSYNANPASMASGLRTLGKLPARTRMAVLGDMLELGKAARDLHRSVGNVAAQSDLSYLALVGEFGQQIKQGAQTSGMDPDRIRVFTDKNNIIDWIEELFGGSHLQPGDWLLVKASRGLALDTVVDQIMERC